jgi:hypothetical protein
MIDIIISYLLCKVNIAFSVLSDQCIVLGRGAHLACADNAIDRINLCRGRRTLYCSLITYHYSLFLKNSGNLLRYVL